MLTQCVSSSQLCGLCCMFNMFDVTLFGALLTGPIRGGGGSVSVWPTEWDGPLRFLLEKQKEIRWEHLWEMLPKNIKFIIICKVKQETQQATPWPSNTHWIKAKQITGTVQVNKMQWCQKCPNYRNVPDLVCIPASILLNIYSTMSD